MALGFDELVTHLLDEIALSGSRGFGVSEFESSVRQFYQERKNAATTTEQDSTTVNPLFSNDPPEAATVVDHALLDQVWQWLTRHDDIYLENKKSTTSDAGLANVPGTSIPPEARVFATENRAWQAIAGHGKDLQRVPRREFELLSVIASKRADGILQPDLVAATGQDKRSVPKRTDNLAKNGYITKEPTLAKGSNTSHLRLKKFSTGPESETQFIFYNTWFDETIRMLKEQENHVIAYQDIRIGLGIEGKKHQTSSLHRCIRRLTESGCIQKLTAREEVDEFDRGPNHSREIRCLRLVREPTYLDRIKFQRGSTDKDSNAFGPKPEDDWDHDELDTVMEHGAGAAQADQSAAQWNPRQPYPNLLYNLVKASGPQGITTNELQTQAFGPLYKRPMEDMISKMSNAWNSSQPSHLRHLCIIRDTTMRGRNTLYLYRTYDNFQLAVEQGLTVWEAVQSNKKKKGRPNAASSAQLDEWGFPQLPDKDFFSKDEVASLADIAASVEKTGKKKSVSKSKAKAVPKAVPKKVSTPSKPVKQKPVAPSKPVAPLKPVIAPSESAASPTVSKPIIIPEKEIQDFKSWANRTAALYTRIHGTDGEDARERRAALAKSLAKKARNGVYINPPGSRSLRFGTTSSRGRPRKGCVAVFKLPGLRELSWFTDDSTTPSQMQSGISTTGENNLTPSASLSTQPIAAADTPATLPGSSIAPLQATVSPTTNTPALTPSTTPLNGTVRKKRKRSKFDIDDAGPPKRRLDLLAPVEESGFSHFVRSVGRMHMPTHAAASPSPGPAMISASSQPLSITANDLPPLSGLRQVPPTTPYTPVNGGSASQHQQSQAPGALPALAIVRPYVALPVKTTQPQPTPPQQAALEGDPMDIDAEPAEAAGPAAGSSYPADTEAEHDTAVPEAAADAFASASLELIPPPIVIRNAAKKITGMIALKRGQLILETIRKCGGVYPGEGEIWYPVSTAWIKLYNQSTDRHTITQAVEYLHGTEQLKKVRFPFRTARGRQVHRQLLVLAEIDIASEKVQNLRQAMIASWPHPFFPLEAEITPEVRRKAEGHHLESVRPKAGDPLPALEEVAPQQPEIGSVLPEPAVGDNRRFHHYKENFPAAPGVVVKRTSAARKVLKTVNAQKVKSIYNNRTGLELLPDGTIGRRYLPSQAAHSILHPDFLNSYIALNNGKATLTTLKPLNLAEPASVPTPPSHAKLVESPSLAQPAVPAKRSSTTAKRSRAEIVETEDDGASVSSEPEKKKTRRRGYPKPSLHQVSLLMMPRLVHHEATGTIGTISTQTTANGRRRKAGTNLVATNRLHASGSSVSRTRERKRESGPKKAATRRVSSTTSRSQTPAAESPVGTPVMQPTDVPTPLSWGPPMYPGAQMPTMRTPMSVFPAGSEADTVTGAQWSGFRPDFPQYVSSAEGSRQSTPLGTVPNSTEQPRYGQSDDISRRIGQLNWDLQSSDQALFPRLSQFANSTRDSTSTWQFSSGYLASSTAMAGLNGTSAAHPSPSALRFSQPQPDRNALASSSRLQPVQAVQPAAKKRKYQSRKKSVDDAETAAGKGDEVEEGPARKYQKKKTQSSSFSEVQRLVTAVAVSKLLAGGLKGAIQWDVVVHCMSFRYESDLLRGRWRYCREQREEEAEAIMVLLQEPFLEAYKKGELPDIDYQQISETDWPAILEWAEKMVARNKELKSKVIAPDLPATREEFRTQLQLLPTGKPGAVAKERYFTSEVWPRKELAHNHVYGVPVHTPPVQSTEEAAVAVAKTYCRAVTLTRSSLYNSEEAGKKIQELFSGPTIEQASKALVAAQYFATEKKDRMLPGRNYHLHNNVPKTLKRWPGDERAHLRMIASSRRNIVRQVQEHGIYKLTMHTFDPDMVVLTSMVAQGHLHIKLIPPARNDDPKAPFPKLTAWGYGDGDYFMRDVEPAKFRFPIVYEPTDKFTAQHGLTPTPIPLQTTIKAGEPAARIPFWVDIHGHLIEDAWDMAFRSLLFLLVYRPGSTAQSLCDAEKEILGVWEIEMALGWMEEVGIAERCGGEGGWKATEWWYCAFAADVATWDVTGGPPRW